MVVLNLWSFIQWPFEIMKALNEWCLWLVTGVHDCTLSTWQSTSTYNQLKHVVAICDLLCWFLHKINGELDWEGCKSLRQVSLSCTQSPSLSALTLPAIHTSLCNSSILTSLTSLCILIYHHVLFLSLAMHFIHTWALPHTSLTVTTCQPADLLASHLGLEIFCQLPYWLGHGNPTGSCLA